MQTQITRAFAQLNARLIESDQAFAIAKMDGARAFVEQARVDFKEGKNSFTSGYGRFDCTLARIAHYGSKALMNLLEGRGRQGGLDMMRKNTESLIAKRDAQIIKALTKAGITEIPEFELVECSDGIEGVFNVAGHVVTIRTILAGGYNIQRLHNRTLVKVRKSS